MKTILSRLFLAGAGHRRYSNAGLSSFTSGLLIAVTAILLSPGAPPARAQSTSTGTVSGQVVDPQNAAVSGASVTLRDTTTHAELKTVTNDAGRYTFVNIAPGLYDMTVT